MYYLLCRNTMVREGFWSGTKVRSYWFIVPFLWSVVNLAGNRTHAVEIDRVLRSLWSAAKERNYSEVLRHLEWSGFSEDFLLSYARWIPADDRSCPKWLEELGGKEGIQREDFSTFFKGEVEDLGHLVLRELIENPAGPGPVFWASFLTPPIVKQVEACCDHRCVVRVAMSHWPWSRARDILRPSSLTVRFSGKGAQIPASWFLAELAYYAVMAHKLLLLPPDKYRRLPWWTSVRPSLADAIEPHLIEPHLLFMGLDGEIPYLRRTVYLLLCIDWCEPWLEQALGPDRVLCKAHFWRKELNEIIAEIDLPRRLDTVDPGVASYLAMVHICGLGREEGIAVLLKYARNGILKNWGIHLMGRPGEPFLDIALDHVLMEPEKNGRRSWAENPELALQQALKRIRQKNFSQRFLEFYEDFNAMGALKARKYYPYLEDYFENAAVKGMTEGVTGYCACTNQLLEWTERGSREKEPPGIAVLRDSLVALKLLFLEHYGDKGNSEFLMREGYYPLTAKGDRSIPLISALIRIYEKAEWCGMRFWAWYNLRKLGVPQAKYLPVAPEKLRAKQAASWRGWLEKCGRRP